MKGQKKQSYALMLASLIMLVVLIGGNWSSALASAPLSPQTARAAYTIPTFSIVSVEADETVTIQTYNFPAGDTYHVLMGYIGTQGIGGTEVATIDSGSGGSFTQTFNIPDYLAGQERIAIRLESWVTGYYSFNWFWNSAGGSIPVTGPTPYPYSYYYPTFSITGVVRDDTVSIRTANFPANDTFNITMGVMGTRGIGGISVGTFSSNAGGTLTATFDIPAALIGLSQVSIRLESPTSGYYAYNWFWNSTAGDIPVTGATATPGPTPTSLPPQLIPTISIVSVVADSTVTIQTANYPANDNYVVTMGLFGTRGVGGIQVASFNSGAGGTQTATFTIPAALYNEDRIAIRLQSPTSGYYSFNWFYNQ